MNGKPLKGAGMTIKARRTPALAIAMALAVTLLAGALAATQALAATHFDGKVLGKDSQSKTFRADTQQAGNVRFHTNGGTDFERIPGGFSGLEPGMKVEVTAKRSNGHWLATVVERQRNN
jgi:hypothetical protein